MWWHVIFNIYTFLSTCKLWTIRIFSCFCITQFCFDEYLAFYFDFCVTLLWLFMRHIFKAIWKSICIYILRSASAANFYFFFPLKRFYWHNKTFIYDHYNSCAHLFDTSITFLQLIISLYYLFSDPSRGIHWCFMKKFVWIFRVPIYY